jgi:hypothetical protein
MGQYQTGTVTLVSGSNKVSGESCAWITAGVAAGHTFKKADEDAFYTIGLVNSELTLSLTSEYAGASCSGESYQICRDFTDNYSIPEIWAGDKEWAYHLTEGLRIIDTGLAAVAASAGLIKDVEDQGSVSILTLTTSDLNKVHLLKNSGETTLVYLPSVGSSHVGSWLDLRKRGSGEVCVYPSDSDLINKHSGIKNETEQTFAQITLTLEEETEWGAGPFVGDWVTL